MCIKEVKDEESEKKSRMKMEKKKKAMPESLSLKNKL